MQPRHAAIVYNPVKVPLDRITRAVEEQERLHGWGPSRWYETAGEDAGRGAAEDALTDRPAVVVVGGGDGTVRTVAEVVQDTGIPLALLPAGTGHCLQSFARHFRVVAGYPEGQQWDIRREALTPVELAAMEALPFPSLDPIDGKHGPLVAHWLHAA